MAKLPSRAKRIAHLQHHVDERIALGAVGVGIIGGDPALVSYLDNTLGKLLEVAIAERGKAHACQLMAAGLMVAQAYVE